MFKKLYVLIVVGFAITNECFAAATCTIVSCDKDYYVSGNSCKACDSLNGVKGQTAGAGLNARTDCCLPASATITYTDAKGTYTFPSGCCYKD